MALPAADVMREHLQMIYVLYGAPVALCLAVLALLLLAAAPVGWRLGWWHYRFAFTWLMSISGCVGLAAASLGLFAILLGRSRVGTGGAAMAGTALIVGALLTYVPLHYNRLRGTLPRIHDITTDTEQPPQFAAVLPARAAEHAATAHYEGDAVAMLQRAAYPDIVPLELAVDADKAFAAALAAARAMPRWTIVACDPVARRIEASEPSRWFHFTDDIVIRVTAEAPGARIDMRSLSRQGRSDFGVNAARIRSYMRRLRQHTP
jgi:uncharacterized protein (DUF1499 family)